MGYNMQDNVTEQSFICSFFFFTGLLLVPYGLMYSARTVRIAHCFNASMYVKRKGKGS